MPKVPIVFFFVAFLSSVTEHAFALPEGGVVTAGSASLNSAADTLTIQQHTDRAVINWNSFSIQPGELTRFSQPAISSAVLNRVLGGDPSSIYGSLRANGSVFLINPNGVVVGPDGIVNTGGGFLASTLDIENNDFMSGSDLSFTGESLNGVVNYGSITANEGDVVLLGYSVENHGSLAAPGGEALLGAGQSILLKAAGKNRLYIQTTVDQEANAGETGVNNQGVINAASAQLKAAGGNAYALAVNNDGLIEAKGISSEGGRIVLTADDGNVRVGGTLRATASQGQGGEILVGGEYQGSEPALVANARNVLVSEDALLDVSAEAAIADGGRAIVWADDSTYFYGNIDARGGREKGDGGFAEVSGKRYLDFQGRVDLRATDGENGELLLDPTNVEIRDGVGEQNVFGPAGNVIGSNGTSPTIINASTINTQLGLGDLTIQTNGAGAEAGDIIVNSAITWNSNNTLSFDAHNSIIINASITANGPTAILNLFDFNGSSRGAGDISSAAGATLTAFEVNLATAGNVTLDGAVITPLLRINSLGVGGSFSATNVANEIDELSFASATQMTGDVTIVDSSGGLTLRFSTLDTLGSVSLSTPGILNINAGTSITTANDLTLEAGQSTTVDGTLTSNGNITSTSDVTVSGTLSANGDINVTGIVTETGSATVVGNVIDLSVNNTVVTASPVTIKVPDIEVAIGTLRPTIGGISLAFGATENEIRTQDQESAAVLSRVIGNSYNRFEKSGSRGAGKKRELKCDGACVNTGDE